MRQIRKSLEAKIEKHLGCEADDGLFAYAMTHICEGYPPACSIAETCMHDGDCFDSSKPHINAARLIEKASDEKPLKVRQYMEAAARALRNGDIYLGASVHEFP